ncbi:MAG: amino acid ABC transporter substrate-binding protein [Rhizobiales bacterium]|nr:amino acid ABC transporter substrate-binding protein [Hyphomicrobiales bacterium]
MLGMKGLRKPLRMIAAVALLVIGSLTPSRAADPIKVGFSMALTGAVAQNGKQLLIALEIWRDDVNAKGGLLGRPVELVYYDDQSNPSNVPGIYTKLMTVDKVDLLVGPYATNMVAPAMPVIMQANKTTISLLAIGVNSHFNYSRYFSMVPVGPEGVKAFSRGYFELAAAQKPKPKTVAMIAADAEFAKTAADGAKANAKALGFDIIYDKTYPPSTTDFSPVVRAVQAANADIVFVASYPPDTVGIIRAANEIGYQPKMFGGTMIGLLVTPLKVQLGPLMNGMTIMESFVPAPSFNFPGLQVVLDQYRKRATDQRIDPFGYGFVPFGYAAGQILAQAVTATKSLDHDKIAKYIHANAFKTVAGDIAYNANGDWTEARTVFTQFQNVAPNNIEQFRTVDHQVIVWPDKYKTGKMVYPYADAKK